MTMIDVTPGVQRKFILQSLLGATLHIGIGYLVGMVFSDHIYADVSRTEWSNLWVYFWLLFWPFGLAVVLWFYALIAAVIAGLGFILWQKLRR